MTPAFINNHLLIIKIAQHDITNVEVPTIRIAFTIHHFIQLSCLFVGTGQLLAAKFDVFIDEEFKIGCSWLNALFEYLQSERFIMLVLVAVLYIFITAELVARSS